MAEAISFRRGIKSDNDIFVGVEGEIVVDLGEGLMATQNERVDKEIKGTAPTIRLHTGNGLAGGIRMARADMVNVNTEFLGTKTDGEDSHEGPNLLYEDLSNISTPDDTALAYATENVKHTLDLYEIAWKGTENVNTADLVDTNKHPDGDANGNKPLSYRDMSNVTTVDLATAGHGHAGKNLTYYDMSNMTTDDLATAGHGHAGKNLAYFDMSNMTTDDLATAGHGHAGKNLAYFDMTNIDNTTLINKIDNAYDQGVISTKYEKLDNKVKSANFSGNNINDTKYPTTKAVKTYVDTEIGKLDYATPDLNNIRDWTVATYNKNYFKVIAEKTSSGSGYQIGAILDTGISILTPTGNQNIKIEIEGVDGNGAITTYRLYKETQYANAAIPETTYTDSSHHGQFKLSTVDQSTLGYTGGQLMKDNLSNSRTIQNNTWEANIGYSEIQDSDVLRITPYLTGSYKTIPEGETDPTIKSTAIVNCTGTAVQRTSLDGTTHNGWSVMSQMATRTPNATNKFGLFVCEEGAYYVEGGNWAFTRDNLISTVGYCDKKQNTQNITVVSGGSGNINVNLKDDCAIYYLNITAAATIILNIGNVHINNNQAKTFELYVKVGSSIPQIQWNTSSGAPQLSWMTDSEQSPLNNDKTSIFTMRVQNINGTKSIVANYGGEF